MTNTKTPKTPAPVTLSFLPAPVVERSFVSPGDRSGNAARRVVQTPYGKMRAVVGKDGSVMLDLFNVEAAYAVPRERSDFELVVNRVPLDVSYAQDAPDTWGNFRCKRRDRNYGTENASPALLLKVRTMCEQIAQELRALPEFPEMVAHARLASAEYHFASTEKALKEAQALHVTAQTELDLARAALSDPQT